MKSLPAEARSRKRPKPVEVKVSTIAHNLEAKPRTEDVKLSEEDRNKDFSSLMLSDSVLKGLRDSGFLKPSPIQLAAIPNAKLGLDMIVQSKSGTGKTCVYVVTALEMLKKELPGLQVLVLAPTREIAMQGLEVANQIGSSLPGLKIASFIGGLPLVEDKIKAPTCQMAIGTPGRLKQLFTEKCLNPDTIRLVILDEADKLLEQSFLEDTKFLLDMLPSSKQVMALSATYPDELARLAEKLMRSPQHIRLAQESQVLYGVAQFCQILEFSPAQTKQNQIKQAALIRILSTIPYNQCLIFSNYQILAQSTADFLNSRGFPSICISAGQDQLRRLQAIQSFKTFKCRILCSTDLTARGIDAENVNLVINYDIPEDHNTYLHRIGRGGRFGSSSVAVSLAPGGKEEKRLRKIVTHTGSHIKILPNETLPKNVREADLPLLEGSVSEPELSGSESCELKDENEQGQELGDDSDKKKKSGKIKRRGKKKPRSERNANTEMENQDCHETTDQEVCSKEQSSISESVSKDAIRDILEKVKNDTCSVSNFDEFVERATKSTSLIPDPRYNSIIEVQNVVEKMGRKQNSNIFDSKLKKSKQHLEYRSVREILDFVSNDKSLPDQFESLTLEDSQENVTLDDHDQSKQTQKENHDSSDTGDSDEESVKSKNEEVNIDESEDSEESSEEESESEDSEEDSTSSSSESDSDSEPAANPSMQHYQQLMMNQYLLQQNYQQRQQQALQQQLSQQQQALLLQQQHVAQQQQQMAQQLGSGGYSSAQLLQWYSNVAAQSRQIQQQSYYATLQNIQQNLNKKS